jgi:hypothetical protein
VKKPPTTQGGGNSVKQLDVLGPKKIIPPPREVSSGVHLAPHEAEARWGYTVPATLTEEKARIKAQREAFRDARNALEEKLGNSAAKKPEILQQNKVDVVKENSVQAKPQGDGQPGSPSGGPPPDNGLSGPGSKGNNIFPVSRPDTPMEELPYTPSDYTPGSSEGSTPDLSPYSPSSPVQGPDKLNAEHISDIKHGLKDYELADVPGSRPAGVSGPSVSNSNQADILRDFDFGDKKLNEAWREIKWSDLPPMELEPGMKPIEPLNVKNKVGLGGSPLPPVDSPKSVEGLRNPVEPASAVRPGEPNPGVTRGTPPKANPAGNQGAPAGKPGDPPSVGPAGGKSGNQAVQGAKHWDPVDTSGGLRHEISPGAVNDAESGYNKYAKIQELHGTHDGKPVPGRNKLPQLDGTIDDALHNVPPELERFGAEMTDAVEDTTKGLIHGAKGKEAKMWKELAPEIVHVEKGWQKVLGAINKGWDAIWDTILWPIKKLFKMLKTLISKIMKWLGVVTKGVANSTSVFSKIAAGFVKVFDAVRATKAWKIIKYGPKLYELWVTKVGPWLMKNGAKWLGKALSAVGWCTLLLDVMDLVRIAVVLPSCSLRKLTDHSNLAPIDRMPIPGEQGRHWSGVAQVLPG